MKFFKLSDYLRSWSVWIMSAFTGLATVDYSTTWLDGVIPDQYKPVVYAGLGFLGLLARSIKQSK